MKNLITLFSFTVLLFIVGSVNAQNFQFGLAGYSGFVLGDLNTNLKTNQAYDDVIFSAGGNVYGTYYFKNNIGVGFRFDYADFERDADAFNEDLVSRLGILDSNYILQRAYLYSSYSFQVGASYVFKVTDLFQVEPYLYIGTAWFTTPFEHGVFYKNNETYTYRKDKNLYLGFHYTPGVKFQFNLGKHLGINIFVEYKGMALGDQVEETTIYSATSFNRYTTAHSYSVNAINTGLGVNFTFGGGE